MSQKSPLLHRIGGLCAQIRLILKQDIRLDKRTVTFTSTASSTDREPNIHAMWQAALGELELQMPRSTFDTWLKGTRVIAYEDGLLIIGTQNGFAKDWLENRLQPKIRRTVVNILGRSVELKFRVRPSSAEEDIELLQGLSDEAPAERPPEKPDVNQSASTGYTKRGRIRLNPRYTFENFVVGGGNRLAHAAAIAVSEHPAERYNPLFIYGGVGLGKTHLLHATGHIPITQGLQVRVVSSEEFTNDLISAIRSQTTEAFREKYRDLDVLLIDDIQFIAGKEQTQEEFFHTFNTLHSANKQIIMTSDRHPKGLTTLEERLRSRFEWGLTVDIQPPDLETRIAILQSKAERHPVPIPMEVLELIARQIRSNIRELEGALNQVVMYAQCMQCTVTADSASQALSNLVAARPDPPSVPELLEIVADFYSVTVDDILGRSRSRRIALPRQVAMYLLREEVELSFPQIGDEIGGRDHSTAMHAYNKIEKLIAEDDSRRREIMEIRNLMYQVARV